MTKNYSTENSATRPLSYPENFSVPEICWITEIFLYELFRYCETTDFWRKIVILPSSSCPYLIRKKKFDTGNFLELGSTEGFGTFLRTVSVMWDKTMSTENLGTPHLALLSPIFEIFGQQRFSENQKGSPTKIFGTVRQQSFDMEFFYSLAPSLLPSLPSSYPKKGSTPEFFWRTAQKGFFTKCFRTVRQEKFDAISW